MYRSVRPLKVWRDLDRMQRDMNRLFNSYSPSVIRTAPSYPAINIWANDEGQIITAEMPGIDAKDIDIDVSADTLTLSGECKSTVSSILAEEQKKVSFATKAEADKPKKITIKSK